MSDQRSGAFPGRAQSAWGVPRRPGLSEGQMDPSPEARRMGSRGAFGEANVPLDGPSRDKHPGG